MPTSSSPATERSRTEASASSIVAAAHVEPAPRAELSTELSAPDGRMHQNASGCYTPHACAAELVAQPATAGADVGPPAPRSRAEAVGIVVTVQQEHAIDLFVTGRNDVEVAAALRVHRTTVTRWRLHHLGFRAALSRRRHEVWGAAADRFRGMLDSAVDVLQRQLADDDPSVSFRAARLLVQMAGAGRFVPPDQPTDPLALLDEHARDMRRAALADDPTERPVRDTDRVAALNNLYRRFNAHVEPGSPSKLEIRSTAPISPASGSPLRVPTDRPGA
jgi:hypothetical protein